MKPFVVFGRIDWPLNVHESILIRGRYISWVCSDEETVTFISLRQDTDRNVIFPSFLPLHDVTSV